MSNGKNYRKKAKSLTQYAINNRLNPTDAESKIHSMLNKKNTGFRWTFERPYKAKYILDFFCAQAKLVVEVDGGYHFTRKQKDKDLNRDGILFIDGISVVRITNNEAIYKTNEIIQKIAIIANERFFKFQEIKI